MVEPASATGGSRPSVRAGWRRDLGVLAVLARGRVRSEMQYRTSFVTLLAGELSSTLVDIAGILALFSKVHSLGGWTRNQVLVGYAITSTSFAIADALVSPIALLPEWVRLGRFDRLMVRPAGSLAQMLGHEFQLRRFGKLFQPITTLLIVWHLSGIGLAPWRLALATLAIVGSTTMFAALYVATASVSFWSPSTDEVSAAFTYGGEFAGQYPTHVFGTWLRRWLFMIVPVGLTSYAPVVAILGAPNPLGLPRWLQVLGPLAAVPAVLAAAAIWRAGTRHYTSTGS